MNPLIKQFVDNIVEHNLAEAKDCFNLIISKKIDKQLASLRKVVANNMIRAIVEKKAK